jgi:hypothetical protein
MVLNELGSKIADALASISNAETIDEKVLDACLKEIATALLQADVNVKLVMNLRNNVKARANNADKGAGLNKRKIIDKAVMDELCSLLDSGYEDKKKTEKEFKKGQPNVVMFVGLQVGFLSAFVCILRLVVLVYGGERREAFGIFHMYLTLKSHLVAVCLGNIVVKGCQPPSVWLLQFNLCHIWA